MLPLIPIVVYNWANSYSSSGVKSIESSKSSIGGLDIGLMGIIFTSGTPIGASNIDPKKG